MMDIEHYKNKRVAIDGENAFTTPTTSLNVSINAPNQRFHIADFSSLYSGEIRFWSISESYGSGAVSGGRLILVDENGIETSIDHDWSNTRGASFSTLSVKAGQVYKIYAEFDYLTAYYSYTVTECYFTGAVVDTFCPVFIKA